MTRAVIIGAGMGGLATALRLSAQGFDVTVLEKGERAGGRSGLIESGGFRVDTGPTILVMKDAFIEMYRSIGEDFEIRLKPIQLDPNYRIHYHDGSQLNLHANMARLAEDVESIAPGSAERLFQFIGAGALKYRLGMDFVDCNYDHITELFNPKAGLRLLKTRAHQNLYRQTAEFFDNHDKLAKAFSFHSMFLGLSPFDAPAMYSLITYADLALGMWYPRGGIYGIIEDMLSLAAERGVLVRTQSPVGKICIENDHAVGVMLDSGEYVPADLVISNADLPYTYKRLIDPKYRREYPDRRLDRMNYACSGFLLYLGVEGEFPHLTHQGLYFSEDYRSNLDAIFKTKTLPDEPSFHLNVPTITDPSLAPPGHSLIYVLAPMPNQESGIDWELAAPIVRGRLLDRLEEIVAPDIRERIVWERCYSPSDWERDINATLGTAFGSLSQGFFQSAYFRPHNKSHDIAGLYFVGQSTYPGIGMPMVVISSKLVTERIVQEWS